MKSLFKVLVLIVTLQPVNAQIKEEKVSDSYNKFQTFLGFSKSFALDENFIGDAYKLKFGAEIGGAFLFTENFFAGVQVDVLWTDVGKPDAVGGIVKTRIISSSGNIGYLMNVTENFDVSAKLGLGHARYAHRADINGRAFHDDGFITYIEPKLSYNMNKTFGIYFGFNFRYDKMNIKTSEFYGDYFGSSIRGAINLGTQFSF